MKGEPGADGLDALAGCLKDHRVALELLRRRLKELFERRGVAFDGGPVGNGLEDLLLGALQLVEALGRDPGVLTASDVPTAELKPGEPEQKPNNFTHRHTTNHIRGG